jgi:hypothetical protein
MIEYSKGLTNWVLVLLSSVIMSFSVGGIPTSCIVGEDDMIRNMRYTLSEVFWNSVLNSVILCGEGTPPTE